jgi:PAS domain S-box-containing protein
MIEKQSLETYERLNSYLWNAPVAIAIITGDNYKFELLNDSYLRIVGRTREELSGKSAFDVMPELKSQLKALLDNVRATGESFRTEEFPVENFINGRMQRDYYSFSYEPYRDAQTNVSGVFITGHKVTDQVLSKAKALDSREQLQLVADAMPVLISYVDKSEHYVFVNKRYEEWFGLQNRDITGKTMREILGEHAYDAISPHIKNALSGQRISYEALVHYRHRGDTHIHATYVPDFDQSNTVRGIYVFVEDISHRKQAELSAKKTESYLRQLADTVPSIIWLTDATGHCFYLNREWYKVTGQTEEQALGFGWLDATHPEDAPSTEMAFKDANEFQMEYRAVFRLRTSSGDYKWVVDKGRPRFKDDGEFDGFIGTVVDIDKEMTAEHRIRESEEKYRNLFNTMEQGFCIIDVMFDENKKPVDYKFIEVNPVFEKQTGLKDAAGRTARELLPTLEQHWFDLYGKVASTGESARFSEGSDTMGRWFDVYAFKVEPNEGNRVALLFSDVSETRKAELHLKESENRLRAFLTATNDAIYRMSPDWKVMRQLQGGGFIADIDKPIENWVERFIPVEDREKVLAASQEAISRKSIFELEHRISRQDGTIGWTVSRAIPILDHAGNIKEWFGAAADVTQRYLTDEALRESENRFRTLANDLEQIVHLRTLDLKRSNEDLERFAHVASHDLKEPVRKVKIYIDRLKEQFGTGLPEKAIDYLHRIDRASDRMNQMIEGVLKYSTLNSVEQLNTNVNINSIISTVVDDLEMLITQKQAKVHTMDLPTLRGSELLLYQLFYNLVNNSLKFTREDSVPEIIIQAYKPTAEEMSRMAKPQSLAYVKIVVSDNGIGFKNSEAQMIFETFTRLNPKDRFEGTGLGLALCDKIVSKHGGVMWAEGVEGKGAAFSILLPQ